MSYIPKEREEHNNTLIPDVINWHSVNHKLPPLTEENRYGRFSKYMLCRHSDGHLESCMLNEGIDCDDDYYWSYEQGGDLCETVTHWAVVNRPL
jgi:hypothetical protein